MQCELACPVWVIFFDFYIFKISGSDVQKKKKESFICSLIIGEMDGVVWCYGGDVFIFSAGRKAMG